MVFFFNNFVFKNLINIILFYFFFVGRTTIFLWSVGFLETRTFFLLFCRTPDSWRFDEIGSDLGNVGRRLCF